MKIYPDPELPDIEVEWYDGDCVDGTGNIALTLNGVDDTSVHEQVTVACSALKTTFKDVARERFKLEASLLDDAGQEFNHSTTDLDIRNGIDETAYLYFGGGFNNFRVAWTFDMGATCASLGADSMQIDFVMNGETFFISGTSCQESLLFTNVPQGIYTVIARAYAQEAVVAVSPEIPDVAIEFDRITNLGTVVLTPCGADCP